MELVIIGSSSKGNAYALKSKNSTLLIECGVSYKNAILPACDFKRAQIVGCLISHHHADHAGHISELMGHGIKCFVPSDLGGKTHTRELVDLGGGFKYIGLPMKHVNGDGSPCECWAFLIHHDESGWILFCTDTAVIPQDISAFPFTHVLIAANYSKDMIERNIDNGTIPLSRAKHTMLGHMSIETCIKELKAMDLENCISIVLLHLSETNSAADDFKARVEDETGITCEIAEPGLILGMNKDPF